MNGAGHAGFRARPGPPNAAGCESRRQSLGVVPRLDMVGVVALSSALPANAVVPERHPDAPPPGSVLAGHFVRCYGCGDDASHGLRLRVVAGEGLTVSAALEVTDLHQGAPGIAHGGLLSAALDETLSMLGQLTRTSQVTARLETDYRRPVPVGGTVYLNARIDGQSGRRMYVSAEGHLGAVDGPVAVRGRGVFVEVPLQHFVRHGRPEDIEAVARDTSQVNLDSYEGDRPRAP